MVRLAPLMASPPFGAHFATWKRNFNFQDAGTTAARLRAAGFTEIHTDLEPAPATFPTAEALAQFAAAVVLRSHLAHLPTDSLRQSFLEHATALAARADPPFTMDYVRLNLVARSG